MSARDFLDLVPPGRTFVRGLMLKAAARESGGLMDHETAMALATARWGARHAPAVAKQASVLTADDLDKSEAAEFLRAVVEQTIMGRLSGLRRVPFRTRMLSVAGGATGYWVSESAPKPVSSIDLNGSTLDPLKAASIIVVTKESLEAQTDLAEQVLQADLTRAVAAVIDQAFLDSMNGGTAGQTPAAITHGAPSVSATGNLSTDLAALIGAFQGELDRAYFVCSPVVATRIGTTTDMGGRYIFPNIGPRGGSLLGIPVLTTRHSVGDSNGGTLALVDPGGVVGNVEDLDMQVATHATLDMADTPANPGDANTVQVSLWQRNLVAFRMESRANWRTERAGAVAVLEGL